MGQGLFKNKGKELLDQPIGPEDASVRQGRVRGTFQDSARYRRIARRGYREAMRNKDWKSAADALDWLEKKGDTLGSGIEPAGMRRQMADEQTGGYAGGGQVWNTGGRSQFQPFHPVNPTPQDARLQSRLGLFDQMKDGMMKGRNMQDFWKDASKLGVTATGFGNAIDRARDQTFGKIEGWAPTPRQPIPGQGVTTVSNPLTEARNTRNAALAAPPVAMGSSMFRKNPNSPDFDERANAQASSIGLFETLA